MRSFHWWRLAACLSFAFLACIPGTVQAQVDPDLVAAYAFQEGTGTTSADATTHNNPASLNGAVWAATGRFGRALGFTGANSRAVVADAPQLDLTTALTAEAWVNPAQAAGWQTVLLKEATGELAYAIYASDDQGLPGAWVRVSGTSYSAKGPASLPVDTWSHVALTYAAGSIEQSGALRLWVDGIAVATTTVTGAIGATDQPLSIGGNGVWGEYFDGLIDEVRIYRRVLSTAEIAQDMITPVPPPTTTPLPVQIAFPLTGSTVSGNVLVSATPSEGVQVAGIQFLLDGANLGTEDTTAPYELNWNTTSTSNGQHTLAARERSTSGAIVTSVAIIVTVSNVAGGGQDLTIDGSRRFQTIDGFGVNINVASWNGGELRPALDLLVDELGATIFRVIIDNTDWESTNDNGDPQSFAWSYYNTVYTSPKFEEFWSTVAYLNQKGVDSRLMLNFMGPVAAWMGGSRINAAQNDEWVEMIASLVYYAKITRALKFSLLAPMNEPDWDGIEGPQVDSAQYVLLLKKLSQRLDAEGLSDIRLVGPDTASIEMGVGTYMPAMMQESALMAKVDHFGFHNYAGDSGGADAEIKSSAYPTRNFWITEVSNAWDVMTHLSQNPSAVLIWDAYDAVYNHAILAGRGTTPPNDVGNGPPLIDYSTVTRTYTPRKAFYENAQIFRFVHPGAVRIGATESLGGLTVYAFHHQVEESLTVVFWNDSSNSRSLDAGISNVTTSLPLRTYTTDPSRNMVRGADAVIAGGTFSVVVPPFSFFTATNAPLTATPPPPPQAKFIRGDANRDRRVDLADAVYALFVLFQGFVSKCDDALDVNDDGRVDIADPIRLLNVLFLGSTEPGAPFPAEGDDPTQDSLDCDQ